MCVASVTTVMVLTLLLGYFVVLVVNLNALADSLISEIQVVAYLEDQVDSAAVAQLHKQILALDRVEGAHFVSKDVAFKRLIGRMKGRVRLEDVSKNPLPDSFEIRVDRPEYLKPIAFEVEKLEGVGKVKYGEEIAHKMLAFNRLVQVVGWTVLCLLFVSTVLIISNTIRLTVFARRREIDIMQMVGAAGWFIRMPFVLEGILQGVTGATIAAAVVHTSYELVVPQLAQTVPFLPVLLPAQVLPGLIPGLVILGGLVGAIGSLISVNRFLKV